MLLRTRAVRLLLPVLAALLILPGSARADEPATGVDGGQALAAQVGQILAKAPKGARFGLLVTDRDGAPILALDPD